MDDITERLIRCFTTVFPELPEDSVTRASQASVPEWDSIASITLANIIEEEFGIEFDLDLLPEMDNFISFREYLRSEHALA